MSYFWTKIRARFDLTIKSIIMEKIKKLFLLMAILFPAIAFTACSDDEPKEPLMAQAESTVHMLNWAIRSVKF